MDTRSGWGASPVEEPDQPSGPSHICPPVLGLPAQRTVCGHQCHPTIGVGQDLEEGVVSAPRRMNDGDVIGNPRVDAATGGSLEDHDDGSGDPTLVHRGADSLDEGPGRPGSVPPPTGRPGSDHIGRVDEEHHSSITVTGSLGSDDPQRRAGATGNTTSLRTRSSP